MIYREAAVRISQTVLMLARELGMSVGQMFDYQKDGKVTEEEAATHMHKVQVVLEALYSEILDPIAAEHPDLRPKCCACDNCEDDV